MQRETFDLPSGAKIELRQIRLAEENALAAGMAKSSGEAQQQKILSDVLTACTEQIVDPGPYGFLKPGDKPNWRKMLSGDRMATMILLRVISYRDRENYQVSGIRCPSCGRKSDYEVNLFEDLVWRDLDPDVRARLEAGQPFELRIGNALISYTFGTGETQELATALADQYPGRAVSAGMRSRILDVWLDGSDEPIPRARIIDWLDGTGETYEGLTSDDAEEIRIALDDIECGVDTDIELQCPGVGCGCEFAVQLPFDGMFAPRTGRRKRSKRHRGRASLAG